MAIYDEGPISIVQVMRDGEGGAAPITVGMEVWGIYDVSQE